MKAINWSGVVYDEHLKKLSAINQQWHSVPSAIVNLFGDKVQHIDLSENVIRSLDWMQWFTKLEVVVLDKNQISGEILSGFNRGCFPNIKAFLVNKNELEDLPKTEKIFAKIFPNLEYLSLHGNPLCPDGLAPEKSTCLTTYDNYRIHVCNALPKLKFLDHSPVNSKFKGSLPARDARVLKFSMRMIVARFIMGEERIYKPLPANSREPGEHCGIIGRKTYRYVDKNSEGNRYIRNADL